MIRIAARLSVFLGVLLTPVVAQAQESGTILEIETNAPDSEVFVDGSYAGRAGAERLFIDPGSRHIELVAGGRYSWSLPSVSSRLPEAGAGDTISVSLRFPYYYRFESSPPEATVVHRFGDSQRAVGNTPVTLESRVPLDGEFEIRLDGFRNETLTPCADVWNLYVLSLAPLEASEDLASLALSPPDTRLKWID